MNPTEVPTLMAELKASTQDLHTEIEKHMPLFNKDFNKEQYKDLLKKFYAFFAAYESRLLPVLSHLDLSDFYADRKKSTSLKNDLNALQTEIPHASQKTITIPQTKAQVLGSLYVIEGSTLGGQLISKHLRQTLGFPEDQTQYFSGYGALTGPQWKAFQTLILSQDFTQDQRKEAVAAARTTFKEMTEALA